MFLSDDGPDISDGWVQSLVLWEQTPVPAALEKEAQVQVESAILQKRKGSMSHVAVLQSLQWDCAVIVQYNRAALQHSMISEKNV